MKNSTVKRILSCIVLLALCAAAVAGCWLGILGRTTQYALIHTEDGDVREALYRQVAFIPNTVNDTWQEAIRPSAYLGGGYSYTLKAEEGDASLLKKAEKVLKDRAELISGNALSALDGSTVTVTVPETQYNSMLPTVFSQPGEVTFAPYDAVAGGPADNVLTKEHVQQAYYYAPDSGSVQVQVRFNSKGQKAISDLIAGQSVSALYLLADGQPAAYAMLSTMRNGVLAFSFTESGAAMAVVDWLRSGSLPVGVTYESAAAAPAPGGRLLDIAILACAVLALCACVLLVVRCGLPGLVGAWDVVLFIVCFCLSASLIGVNARWIMTLPSMLVIAACLIAFLAGLCVLFFPMGRMIARGRGASAACRDLSRAQLKCQAIACGAVLLAGLLLMIIFRAAAFGVLGRVLAAGALIAFVLLQVFPRLVFACIDGLAGNK